VSFVTSRVRGFALYSYGDRGMRRWHKLLAQTLRDLSFAPAGRTRSVYILGMHRSGTSALTGVLADHGLHLVDAVGRRSGLDITILSIYRMTFVIGI
jgi:hypothetical protein